MRESHNVISDRFPDVLLVEDNPLHVRLVQTMLREVWKDISSLRVAKRLDIAIAHLRKSIPDVILLDLVLLDADHLEGLHAVLSFAPDTPVVVLSAHEDDENALQALAVGAQDYLVKGRVGSDALARSMRFAMVRGGLVAPRTEDSLYEISGRAIIGLDGAVHRVDAGLTRITGFVASQLVGGHVMGITTPDDAGQWVQSLSDVTVDTPSQTLGVSVRTAAGGVLFVKAELIPMLGSTGAAEVVVRFTAAAKDAIAVASQQIEAQTSVSA